MREWTRRPRHRAVVVAAAMVLLASCGDSGDAVSDTTISTVDPPERGGETEVIDAPERDPNDAQIVVETTTTTTTTTTTSTTTTLAPVTTPAPTTTQRPAAADPSAWNEVWPYGGFFDVAQFGVEAVRGSGCGGGGEIGEVIPDGVWYGAPSQRADGQLQFDLACVYYGDSARPFIDEYLRTTSPEQRIDYQPDFWVINNSNRTRAVPVSPDFVVRDAQWVDGRCEDLGPDAGPASTSMNGVTYHWLVIERGQAVFALAACVGG